MDRRDERNKTGRGAAKPRFVLVTPPVDDGHAFAPQLSAACGAADVAAVILRLTPGDDATVVKRIGALLSALPSERPAVLIDGHPRLLARTSADGVHLSAAQIAGASAALLRENRMIGAGRLQSRHEAMVAGENGAHYVLFGEPDANGRRPGLPALIERVEWWSELFVIPCVAYAAHLDEIAPLVAAGAEFIALGEETIWRAPEGVARAMAAAALHLAMTEPVS